MSKFEATSPTHRTRFQGIELQAQPQSPSLSNGLIVQKPSIIQEDFVLRIAKDKSDQVKYYTFKSIKKYNQSAVQNDNFSDYLYMYSQIHYHTGYAKFRSRTHHSHTIQYITHNPSDPAAINVTYEQRIININTALEGNKSFNSKIITRFKYGGIRAMLVMPDNTHFYIKQTSVFSTNVKKEIYKDLQGIGNPQLIGDVEKQNCSCCCGGKGASQHGHVIRFFSGVIEEDMIPLLIALEEIDQSFKLFPTVMFLLFLQILFVLLSRFLGLQDVKLFITIGVLGGIFVLTVMFHALFI